MVVCVPVCLGVVSTRAYTCQVGCVHKASRRYLLLLCSGCINCLVGGANEWGTPVALSVYFPYSVLP